MRESSKRAQLALEWQAAIHWSDLPAATRAEIRALLRELLRHAAHDHDAGQAEGADDE